MKAQGSRNGKALGISELLASASAPLNRSWISEAWKPAQGSRSCNVQKLAAANNKT